MDYDLIFGIVVGIVGRKVSYGAVQLLTVGEYELPTSVGLGSEDCGMMIFSSVRKPQFCPATISDTTGKRPEDYTYQGLN